MQKIIKAVSFVAIVAAVVLSASIAFAAETAAATGGHGVGSGMLGIAVAIGIGIAALGGALGQGRTAAAALEGIARNPNASDKVFVPMILGLAFIESLVLFTWVIMLLMQLKL